MPTEKPRFTITMDEELFKKIDEFKYEYRYKNQTQTVLALIEKGIEVLASQNSAVRAAIEKSPNAAEAAPGEDHMIALYRKLNHEGQEKLIDYADDLVASGKYIKSGSDNLGKEA